MKQKQTTQTQPHLRQGSSLAALLAPDEHDAKKLSATLCASAAALEEARKYSSVLLEGGQLASQRASAYAARIAAFHLPRYDEIPRIDLYMDQLIGYIDEQVGIIAPTGEKLLTSSMVNNYVKQKLVPQPQAKKYTSSHVAYLIVVCVLKQTYSIAEILRLILIQIDTHEVSRAYDFFCTAFEESLRTLFCGKLQQHVLGDWHLEQPESCAFALSVTQANTLTLERRLAIAAVTSAANWFYVQKNLEFMQAAEEA
ncbi:MAG: DUF1836 domain-containing protein [Raoultibacter sp.]